jgi:hypothetical protein
MNIKRLKSATALTALVVGLGCAAGTAQASFIINATVGGAPTGVTYVNFDNLPLGAAGGVSNGVGVSFVPDGQTVVGASSGLYAAPYISASNGVPFGDATVSGADTTRYISTGMGQAKLTFPGAEKYLGMLWGSVDTFNKLEFVMGAVSVGIVTGANIFAAAAGDQGINGTYYANIVSSLSFDSVVASSSAYAFEFDNVAYNPTDPNKVPEPFSIGLLGIGMLGVGFFRKNKNKAAVQSLTA